ncbi:MAG TPA: hypothetical protein GYA10_04485 [Alphaproteobacteria bacterium]|nr:hypothetical protein [Alphaproteobacteria bacterium]
MLRLIVAAAVLAAAPGAAHAADISLVSMHYSASHPVPHIHYDGPTVAGDIEQLQAVYDRFVHCRTECLGDRGGATAVLTLNGPGGDYHTGLALADFLRANHIATVVERGAACYSACAFAFLGGTGFSRDKSIETYVERMVEPGSTVGFHAPYFNDDVLRAVLEERSPSEVLGANRSNISLMVKELVKWNVDPEIVFYMVDMGPDQTYDLRNADDLYLVRTALPPTPTSAWVTDVPEAVRNACLRLLALYERSDPLLLQERITGPFIEGIGQTQYDGPLSGYRLGDAPLGLGHCSVTDRSIATYDLDVALYMTAGIDGTSLPLLSMFNRQDYFSTAGIGGSPQKRVFQRGGLNHWFLPVGVDIDSLDLPGEFAIAADKFLTVRQPALPTLPAALTVVSETQKSRVLESGNVLVIAQVGSSQLFDAARLNPEFGVAYTDNTATEAGFVQQGTYPDGTFTSAFGFLAADDTAAVVRVLVLVPPGGTPTEAELALVREIQCTTQFAGLRLGCG